jgi:hypothetical protein
MPNPIMYSEDAYVVLEPDQPEQFLSADELQAKLTAILATRQGDELPPDVRSRSTPSEQAKYLMDTACEFDVAPGHYLQWYVVRLEK